MSHAQYTAIADYTYRLPEDKIAFHPLPQRDSSRLLIYENGTIQTDVYQNCARHLPPGTVTVFNNTKVVAARLLFTKSSGGTIEIFCLEPHEKYTDITSAMQQKEKVVWMCLVGGASKWKSGQVLEKEVIAGNEKITLLARCVEKRSNGFVIELLWNSTAITFAEILYSAGQIPLPPYIKRLPEHSDSQRYQTVYAHAEGSVAAPTAGLHFSEKVLKDLDEKNIQRLYVTLHVGAGTFQPVKATQMQHHDMHAEYIEVEKSFIEKLMHSLQQPIVAVGTTSLRTIESLYWLGCKLLMNASVFDSATPFVSQWEAYEGTTHYSVAAALQALLSYMQKQQLKLLTAKTQILIVPGYTFKIVSGLITNFHQPASTLLLLVAAFIGEDWRNVYAYALENDFRFLSYGDGSLLWRRYA